MSKDKKRKDNLNDSEIIDNYLNFLEKKDKKEKQKKKASRFIKRRKALKCLVIAVIVICLLLGTFFSLDYAEIFTFKDVSNLFVSSKVSSAESTVSKGQADLENVSSDTAQKEEVYYGEPKISTDIYATTIYSGKDFDLGDTASFSNLLKEVLDNGFNSVFLCLNSEEGLITDTDEGAEFLKTALDLALAESVSVYATVDISKLTEGDMTDTLEKEGIIKSLLNAAKTENLAGLYLEGFFREDKAEDYKTYLAFGSLSGFKDYSRNKLTAFVKEVAEKIKSENEGLVLGLISDQVYATSDVMEGGIEGTLDSQLYRDKNADVLLWMEKDFFDIIFVRTTTSTESKNMPFEKVVNWWSNALPEDCNLGFILPGDAAMEGKGDFTNPDQLTRELMALKDMDRFTFAIDGYSALKKDSLGGAALVFKYISGEVADDYVLRELTFTSPKKFNFTTYENKISIIGASDPNFELTLNGKAAERTEYGYFSIESDLKVGKNTFKFSHKGTTETFTVTYRYVVLQDCTPTSAVKIESGATLVVRAKARNGSSVTAKLGSQTVTLEPTEGEENSDFITYMGGFKIPSVKEDTSLGKVTFTGSHNGVKESVTGGNVTALKDQTIVEEVSSEPSSAPSSDSSSSSEEEDEEPDNYIGVGNQLIAEVVKYQVETFDGNKVDDLSQPYNNYLPKGTIDYCDEDKIYDSGSGNTYRKLRYGKRVYENKDGANIRLLRGSLPSENKISVRSLTTTGSHTVLTLNVDWKAPFKLDYLPQKYYSSTGSNRGNITSVTFNYIDITFCYASQFEGVLDNISENSVFSKAQVIKNTSDYTLRLYLKKVGGFYGWTSYYNGKGDLVLKFLNPKEATVSDNKYGGRLDGITVVVDAGHGGSDGGAVGSNPNYDEAALNLLLAKKIKNKLESIGATVVMTRSDDTSLEKDQRILNLKNASPDFAISVHRNAALNSSAKGMLTCYFNPYTKAAADKINTATKNAGLYSSYKVNWHVFFLSRVSDCPVVLTENGYMSNSTDFNNMLNDSWNDKCADAIVKGTVDYFLTR